MTPEEVNALISLSERAHAETLRYRDYVWKMLIWTLGLFIGVLQTKTWTPELMEKYLGVSVGSIFVLIVAIYGIWNIHFAYKQFVLNRNVMRDCERKLKLFDVTLNGGNHILNQKWKDSDYTLKNCRPHYIQWVLLISISALYCIIALCSKIIWP